MTHENYQAQIEDLREKGLLGSTGDPFWDPAQKMHTCCGSPRAYYHRVGCPACRDIDDEPVPGYSTPKLKCGAWRIDPQVAKTMYMLYTRGADGKPMSLEAIGRLYGKSRQAVYDVFHSRGWPLRSKQHKGLTRAFGIDFTLDGYGRLRGTDPKTKERVYLHRMIWEQANGPVPPRHQIHFKNGDKLDCRLENLELVPYEMLSKIFNPTGKNNMKKYWETRRSKARELRRRRSQMWDDLDRQDMHEEDLARV